MSLFTGSKRNLWINIHLVLVGLFLPLLIIVPLSGTQYLFGVKGETNKTEAFRVEVPFTKDAKAIREVLKSQDPGFQFEYVKNKGSYVVLRPSTRDHYEVAGDEKQMVFTKVSPNWIKIFQELHFGHGPGFVKTLQKIFGIAFFLVILSGFALMVALKKKLPLFLGATVTGVILLVIGLL